jgi:hypothetical protein
MKKTLLLFTFAFGFSYSAFADPCDTDTLTEYIADGSCTIGDLTFSGFSYTSSQLGGGLAPSTDGITLNLATSGGETGLNFSSLWVAGTGQFVDSSITYTVTTSNPNGISDLDLRIVGGAAGSGVATAAETSFAPPLSLFTEFGPGTVIPEDSKTIFPPVGSLTVVKDIGVTGGSTAGGAHISDVFNLFSETSTVPEPSLLILCTGLLALLPVARRKFGF